MGLLDLTYDVWPECYRSEWILREELEACKHHFLKFGIMKGQNKKEIGLTFKQYQLISEGIYICFRFFLITQNHWELWSWSIMDYSEKKIGFGLE